ncbi:MAG: ATP-binding protein [Verrucomicrobiota bacterium]|nr:ATP-binding protein [Verrucomicrobiota bacterium]
MLKRFFTPPDRSSYFLFGPRGTGKTTWLKQHYPHAYWIDLLDPEVFRFFSAGPERLRQILAEHSSQKIVVIDEVQKVPELLNAVHLLIEEKKGYQFILTGSSSRKLKKEGVNLLGGRALLRYMPPFFAKELGTSFNLDRNLNLGMLPIVLDSPTPTEVLRAYAGIYLKEEVQAEGIVRNVGDFARFLETMSFSHASLINASNIARESQISRKTVDGYMTILEDLLLSFRLDIFRRKAKRVLSEHSKFYFFDAGVYISLRPQNLFDKKTELEGGSLEGLVAQHLKTWKDAQLDNTQLHFWRTASKLEVDFIVTNSNCFLAIEVKNGSTIHPADLRGLEAFREDYPEATAILLYRGKQRYKERDILCWPVDDFLLKIHPDDPLPH